ncbi:MAG TPA: sigma-70 family RNA polymerase sigma factor [Candidatus Angelobacter sp.]|nr:sigma-70 family RNA polymerase sigma factor [Candidatus Angelobacter sp.]
MNVHVTYKAGKTPEIEQEFQHQLQKVERRLLVFKPDLVHFHAIVELESGHRAAVTLNLRLPSGQMAAQRSGEKILPVLKAAFSDLIAQITKHKDLLRGRKWRSIRSMAKESEQLGPPEQHVATASEGELHNGELERWISANLPALKGFIERELRYRVATVQLREGQVAVEEVLDEVIVSALSQEDGRTSLLSLEAWFHRLALQAIHNLVRANASAGNISLDSSALTPNVTGSDENVLQFHQPDDRPQEENVIADRGVATPEEIFSSEEMIAQLGLVLREVSVADREAFVLFAVEGFTVEEITRLSSRPPDQVRDSIHKARACIQSRLPVQNDLKRVLLNRSRVA